MIPKTDRLMASQNCQPACLENINIGITLYTSTITKSQANERKATSVLLVCRWTAKAQSMADRKATVSISRKYARVARNA